MDLKTINIRLVSSGGTIYQLHVDGKPLPLTAFWESVDSDQFIRGYVAALTQVADEEFYWEHPPFHADDQTDAYEVAIVPAPALRSVRSNPSPFRSHFTSTDRVVHFPNRGGDAVLIVPAPELLDTGDKDYATIFRFLQNADEELLVDFFKTAFAVARENRPPQGSRAYLSTHGLGVHWLHARVDGRPKYYHMKEYRGA